MPRRHGNDRGASWFISREREHASLFPAILFPPALITHVKPYFRTALDPTAMSVV